MLPVDVLPTTSAALALPNFASGSEGVKTTSSCVATAGRARLRAIAGLVATTAGARSVQGTIDLLLETAEGVVVIDHKSYPGPSEQWPERAREHVPEVDAYASVLAMGGRRVLSKWIHFAIGGGAVRVG